MNLKLLKLSRKNKIGREIRYPKKRPKSNYRLRLFHEWVKMTQKYNKEKAILYLVELYDEDERFLKVGITTTSISKRFKELNYKIRKIKSVTSDIKTIFKLETKVLSTFKKKSYRPKQKFSGQTECFQLNSKKEIVEYIKRIK